MVLKLNPWLLENIFVSSWIKLWCLVLLVLNVNVCAAKF